MKRVFYFLFSVILGFVAVSSNAQQITDNSANPTEEQLILSIESLRSNSDLTIIKEHLDKYDGKMTFITGDLKAKTITLKYANTTPEDIMQVLNRLGYYTYFIDARGKKAVINSGGVIEYWDVKPPSASDE